MTKTRLLAFALVVLGGSDAAAQSWTFVPNLVYGTYPGPSGPQNLLLDLYLPLTGSAPHPLVIWVHGGGWSGGSRFPAPAHATNLCSLGYAVASIDYRLSGVAVWPAQIQDCKGAIRWLRANAATWGIDPERFGVWGSSAGGHLVAFLGTSGGVPTATIGNVTVDLEGAIGGNLGESSRVQAVCDWFGPTDFLAMRDFPSFDHEAPTSPESNLLGAAIQTVPDKAATADPITFLTPDDPPFLVMHGTIDTTVPFNQSELLVAAAQRRAGVATTFFPIQGNGHGGPGFTTAAATALVQAHFGALLLDPPATRVTVAASDAAASEAGDPATFDVSRTGDLSAPLLVRLTWSGSATRGADYAAPPLLAVIPAGAASTSVPVVPQDDGLVEGGETVVVTVCPDAGYRVAPGLQSATAAIADDDAPGALPVVTVVATDPVAAEPGANAAAFLFTRNAPLGTPLVVQYSVSGRAKNGVDVALLPGTVTIAANAASAVVAVAPIDDAAIEPSETVIVAIAASAAYATGTPATAGAHVADDDKNPALPTVSVIATDVTASEPADAGAFFVTRTLGTAVPLAVPVVLSGTAAPGVDLAPAPVIVAIPAGASWAAVPVTPVDDALVEGAETVVLTVQPAPGYQLASAPSKTIVLSDDDVPAAPPSSLRLEITTMTLGTLGQISVGGGQAGQTFGVAAAAGAGFVDLSPLGHVLVDLGTAVLLGGGVLDAAGTGGIAAPIPPDASIAGLQVWLQGFAIAPSGATGSLSASFQREIVLP
jgi:acetyl esterase/lipase